MSLLKFAFFIVCLFITLVIYGSEVQAGTKVYKLGDRMITIRTYGTGTKALFINLHENETTSVVVAKRIIKKYGGRLTTIHHGGTRNIHFHHKGVLYVFDPNRMFTGIGILHSLRKNGKTSSKEAYALVRMFAKEVLKQAIPSAKGPKIIIALHNNSNGRYSVQSYMKGGKYARDAKKVYWNRKYDPDNFFFVTKATHFTMFKKLKMNVVLQDNGRVTNDGSLSVYAAKRGIRYLNVEVQHGNASVQRKMLELIVK